MQSRLDGKEGRTFPPALALSPSQNLDKAVMRDTIRKKVGLSLPHKRLLQSFLATLGRDKSYTNSMIIVIVKRDPTVLFAKVACLLEIPSPWPYLSKGMTIHRLSRCIFAIESSTPVCNSHDVLLNAI